MDPYEATKVVFSRVQSLDPQNASKIMGLFLIQDHGEKEMIRLAFGPESLLHSEVVKARQELGISPNTPSTPSTPSSPFTNSNTNNNTNNFSRQNSAASNSSTSCSRFLPNGIKIPSSLAIPSLASPSASSPSWGASVFSDFHHKSDDSNLINHVSSSFGSNGNGAGHGFSSFSTMSSSSTTPNSTLNPSTPPFYASSRSSSMRGGGGELMDAEAQLQEQLSFLNDSSPTLRSKSTDLYFPHGAADLVELGGGVGDFSHLGVANHASSAWGGSGGLPHRRSVSVSDINLASLLDDPNSGLGWKPCLYYARGFCKNGSSCRFVHGAGGGMLSDSEANLVGSPSKLEMMEHCHELLRSKSMQQQKLMAAAAAMASASATASGSLPYSLSSKGLSLLTQQQQNDSPRAAAAAAALMMGEDLHKFSRSPRGLDNVRAESCAASRQIYLTFPADSTFREEDVSNYFSIYGPVQDVRIPYQQKRMFGFVTFVYPETVKLILAKGNPHFVCDARVLVKPYKEKGKVPDKFRKQQLHQMERGEFSACNSPTALDSRDPFDLPLGPRMTYDTQYILWRRKLEEQADLQQALELQSRRLMDLHLLDVKPNHHHRSLSTGAPQIYSPTQSPNSIFNQPLLSSDRSSPDASDEHCASPPLNEAKQALLQQAINEAMDSEKGGSVGGDDNSNNGSCKENPSHECNIINLPESLEHNLPDSPFASPKKGGAHEYLATFVGDTVGDGCGGGLEVSTNLSATSTSDNSKVSSFLPPTTALDLDMAPFKSSCYFQMPRFSPGHGAIGM